MKSHYKLTIESIIVRMKLASLYPSLLFLFLPIVTLLFSHFSHFFSLLLFSFSFFFFPSFPYSFHSFQIFTPNLYITLRRSMLIHKKCRRSRMQSVTTDIANATVVAMLNSTFAAANKIVFVIFIFLNNDVLLLKYISKK